MLRRAITDPSFVKDIDWSVETFELREVVEQPVVTKTVRVAEEVVFRRKSADRGERSMTPSTQQLDVERVPAEPVKNSA